MLVLRKILLCRLPYVIVFVFAIFYEFITTINATPNYIYQEGKTTLSGTINKLEFNGSKVTIHVKAKEKILVTYYCKTKEEKKLLQKHLALGDEIKTTGMMYYPTSTKNFYSFSYKDYLKYQKINYLFKAETITKTKSNQQFLYLIKEKIYQRIAKLGKVSRYVYTFFLGNSSYIEPEVKNAFQKVGISHLFALSGMHISCLTGILKLLLKRLKVTEKKEFFILQIFLLVYYLLIDSCASISRAMIFFFIFGINRVFNFYISPFSLILLAISILIFINPYYIFDVGFQYSIVISSGLLLCSKKLKSKNKLLGLLKVSFISFLLGLPISLYHFSFINILSILYNIFYVPFISFFIFPLSILTVIFPFLRGILEIGIVILETSVLFLQQISVGIIIFKRVEIYWYIIDYIFIIGCLYTCYRKLMLFLLFVSLLIHFLLPKVVLTNQLYMLDVGQGDSFLFVSNGKLMLVDTGGKMEYKKESWEQGLKSLGGGQYIIQFIHHLGFSKIHKLVLTHGDADHAKEALTLLKYIKIAEVYINDNDVNSLEYKIMLLADSKNIKTKKLKQDAIMQLENFTFQVLSTNLVDENDSSLVLLGNINDKKILMMGDASIKSEQQILSNYNLVEVDILKVGHHGSKTSSSKEFINTINPKYSLISCGKDNKFGHPNKEVLDNLEDSIIYRTDIDGSIMFKFKKDRLDIKTCLP